MSRRRRDAALAAHAALGAVTSVEYDALPVPGNARHPLRHSAAWLLACDELAVRPKNISFLA